MISVFTNNTDGWVSPILQKIKFEIYEKVSCAINSGGHNPGFCVLTLHLPYVFKSTTGEIG
jgi:hypothetical protein